MSRHARMWRFFIPTLSARAVTSPRSGTATVSIVESSSTARLYWRAARPGILRRLPLPGPRGRGTFVAIGAVMRSAPRSFPLAVGLALPPLGCFVTRVVGDRKDEGGGGADGPPSAPVGQARGDRRARAGRRLGALAGRRSR